jgi:methionyl-tRNA formyltransferase
MLALAGARRGATPTASVALLLAAMGPAPQRAAAFAAAPLAVLAAAPRALGAAFLPPRGVLGEGLGAQQRPAAGARAAQHAFGVLRMMSDARKRVVFLGTPDVAARSLRRIIDASRAEGAAFELAAVVSNPPAKAGRNKQLQPSPVHALAEGEGIPVLTPTGLLKKYEDSAAFLDRMRELEPDLCITAAYGQFLPQSFLNIPKHGTLNIHPSLLPKFRGASPVPRALEAGVDVTGVTVLFTVFEMDAGPIVGQTKIVLTGDEKTTELLPTLFDQGTDLLLDLLPEVFSGAKKQNGQGCVLQDDAAATHAAKMDKAEGELWFTENAVYAHNKVRAFSGWPGTTATFVINAQDADEEKIKVKIITTRIRRAEGGAVLGVHQISMDDKTNTLVITCDDGRYVCVSLSLSLFLSMCVLCVVCACVRACMCVCVCVCVCIPGAYFLIECLLKCLIECPKCLVKRHVSLDSSHSVAESPH